MFSFIKSFLLILLNTRLYWLCVILISLSFEYCGYYFQYVEDLKPCEMCQKVINNARIKNVYYLLDKPESKKEYNKTKYKVIHNELSENYKKKLQRFFNNIR